MCPARHCYDGDRNDGIDNNGIDNNGDCVDGIDNSGDGVDGECGGPSTSPLSQSTCLAATPTSPIRAGPVHHSSRRVTAKPPAAIAPVDTTANHLSDTTAYRRTRRTSRNTGRESVVRCGYLAVVCR
jgi:hypothetical protein